MHEDLQRNSRDQLATATCFNSNTLLSSLLSRKLLSTVLPANKGSLKAQTAAAAFYAHHPAAAMLLPLALLLPLSEAVLFPFVE
jgi:hypothetical protein